MLLVVATYSSAQTTFQEVNQNINYCSGLYYAYPTSLEIDECEPPKGFNAFYISHYGRHGSRWLESEDSYLKPYKILLQAKKEGVLTMHGISLLERLGLICDDAKGRYGQLSSKGVLQLRGIAERMFLKYKSVFDGSNASIDSRSTTSSRCIISMAVFNERIKELNPSLHTKMDCGSDVQNILAYRTPQAASGYDDRFETWYPILQKFRMQKCNYDRFFSSIFSDSNFLKNNYIDPMEFYYSLYKLYNTVQNSDLNISLADMFTPNELWNLWQVENLGEYFGMGSHPYFGKFYAASQSHLLMDFINKADEAISKDKPFANFRFGHDSYITPLVILMGLKGCEYFTEDYENLYLNWSDFKISPMAANVQWIFFKNKNNKVLMKVLMNESETLFNGLQPVIGPYYAWDDVRSFLLKRIEKNSL